MVKINLKNASILIVDDQQPNIDLLEGFLEFEGYTNIKTTTDPREVVPLFSQFKPDLILLDLSMPYLSGFEVMDLLQPLVNSSTLLPILVLTADITTEAKQRALSGGASDFLIKPFDLTEVGMRIRNLLYANHLQKQLLNQNQLLEEKVKERTAQLENLNISLTKAKDRAEASDRLKSAFLQTISHEVRTPLNGILGFATLLAMPDISEEEKQEYLFMMENSSNRLIKTITDYVDISMIASGNLICNYKPVGVIKLLNEIKDKFQGECDTKGLNLNLLVPVDQTEVTIWSDQSLLEKVFIQAMDNAIKFSFKGDVTFGFTSSKETIEFFVKDTGIGIEDGARDMIFDRFMQEDTSATRAFEGSGLGLSIIKGILKFMDAKFRLESEKGEGTAFYFSLSIDTKS